MIVSSGYLLPTNFPFKFPILSNSASNPSCSNVSFNACTAFDHSVEYRRRVIPPPSKPPNAVNFLSKASK